MDKNTFWSYTTPLNRDENDSDKSPLSESDSTIHDYFYMIYTTDENLLNEDLVVRDFDMVDSQLELSDRIFRERDYLMKKIK